MSASSWSSIVVPAKTPQAIIDKINADIAAIIKDPSFRDKLEEQGAEFMSASPAKKRRPSWLRKAIYGPRWSKASGIKPRELIDQMATEATTARCSGASPLFNLSRTMKQIDRPVTSAAPNDMGWASDVAAEMLRRLNIKYVSLNPGASYRGFHDSLVNYLGNGTPQMLLCLHEDHVVSIAHGYAKVDR